MLHARLPFIVHVVSVAAAAPKPPPPLVVDVQSEQWLAPVATPEGSTLVHTLRVASTVLPFSFWSMAARRGQATPVLVASTISARHTVKALWLFFMN